MSAEAIVYRYAPRQPGESFVSLGVPARDLTQADVDALSIEGRIAVGTPGPKGRRMYLPVEAAGRTGAPGPTGTTGATGATGSKAEGTS